MTILGIDPGLATSGYAIVRADGDRLTIRDAGVFRTHPKADLATRLAQIDGDVSALLDQWPVQALAIERLYSHYRHPRTAVLMGHARGVIICAAGRRGIEVRQFGATEVKRFLTGNGRAGKAQVQQAVMSVYGLTRVPEPHDVSDALALAYCGLQTDRNDT